RVRAPAAEVAVHPHRNRGSIWRRIGLEERYSREHLARLTVAALDDIAAIPRVAHRVHHGSGGALDGNDRLTDGALSRGLARFRDLFIEQNVAGCAIAHSAA